MRWIMRGLFGLILGTGLCTSMCLAQSESNLPADRLSVAVLWFDNRTGDPNAAHWAYGITGLILRQLEAVKAIRLTSQNALHLAFHQTGTPIGSAVDADLARRMGRIIEAQRVVWGSIRREPDRWRVSARVLNVATGETSVEVHAASDDWFSIRDRLFESVLDHLGIEPSSEEHTKMVRPHINSKALEPFSRFIWAQNHGEPARAMLQYARQAAEADPNSDHALGALGAALLNMGKQEDAEQAEQALRKAVSVDPNAARAWYVLGELSLMKGDIKRGQASFEKAYALDPDDSDSVMGLGRVAGHLQGQWDQALALFQKAATMDPTNAEIHACVGVACARLGKLEAAMQELRDAERLCLPGMAGANTEQQIAQCYEQLRDLSSAVQHYRRMISLARQQQIRPGVVDQLEKKVQEIQARLQPTFIDARMPRIFDDQALQQVLAQRLTPDEVKQVFNPLACTPEMKSWAEEITRDAPSAMDKAKALFDTLIRRSETAANIKKHTAQEVFSLWNDPSEGFDCMDYTVLYVSLARAVGLNAFYTYVSKDPEKRVIGHACASVFADGKALLVDPALAWFGVPHARYAVMDDVQAMAVCGVQIETTAPPLRIACKLDPNSVLIRVAMAGVLMNEEHWTEAREVFTNLGAIEPNTLEQCFYEVQQSRLAYHDKDANSAEIHVRSALSIDPTDASAHYYMGCLLAEQGRLTEARKHFRSCIIFDPGSKRADTARAHIATLNERIWKQGQAADPNSDPNRPPA